MGFLVIFKEGSKMKKVIGWILVGIFVLFIFFSLAHQVSLVIALIVVALALFLVGCLIGGLWLLLDNAFDPSPKSLCEKRGDPNFEVNHAKCSVCNAIEGLEHLGDDGRCRYCTQVRYDR